jgi:hypothetical protein
MKGSQTDEQHGQYTLKKKTLEDDFKNGVS